MPTSTCENPRCTCDPCLCEDCRCNTVRLGRLEQQVMRVLWAAGGEPCSGRQVSDALPEHAYTTVATVLDRLSNKGLVHREMDGRVRSYTPVGTEATHTAALMEEALEDSRDRVQALVALAGRLTPAERAALRP